MSWDRELQERVTFDYRGWGGSDARLIAEDKPMEQEGKLIDTA